MSHDVVTFGEAMIRLSPPGFRRLEQAHSLDVQIGGAELNTAVALVRLGHRAAWVSRLTRNPLGRLLENQVRASGVSTEHLVWTDEDRVGLYFVEFGAAPRASSVVYDRRESAIARLHPGTVDWSTVFAGARWFHVTGITPALSATAAEATREALQQARAAGVRISIDLNYRAKLWNTADAQRWMTEFMQWCDVLITTEEDAEKVLGVTGTDYDDVARQLGQRFPLQLVAITLRENPLVWKNRWTAIAWAKGAMYRTRTYDVEVVDRLGAGDSFAAGLIHGLLNDDVQQALDWGVAISALKHSVPGDFAWISATEVEALLKGTGLRISR
jgi:2-dehydro-3-deoxygluconokinase